MARVQITPTIYPCLGFQNDEERLNNLILFIKNENYFSHFGIYLNNCHRPKLIGTKHTCDVKLK
jgi:hypothetical protein